MDSLLVIALIGLITGGFALAGYWLGFTTAAQIVQNDRYARDVWEQELAKTKQERKEAHGHQPGGTA